MLFLSMTQPKGMHSFNQKGLGIELRLDLFDHIDIQEVRNFICDSERQVLLTVRKNAQETLILKLLALEPSFFDLEYDMRPAFLFAVIQRYPKTKFILSYHDFQGIPKNLEAIYQAMKVYPAYSYKIAVMTQSTNEALKMLLFAKHHPKTSVICMGETGTFARICGPIAGNLIDFAYPDGGEKTAPGQLSFSEFVNIYRYFSLNQKTSIYGLIGNPVEKSPGHLYHNAIFQEKGLNAVYVKMNVKAEELSEFFPLAAAIGIRGLSVTAPLKEKILPFLQENNWGAINTIHFKNEKIIGTNTDGPGALDAIEKRMLVADKKVVLLGAGGAASGIAFEANKRGASLIILNRTIERAKQLAADLGCEAGTLNDVPQKYDILINCTSVGMPIDPKQIMPHTIVMDICHTTRETDFLKQAALKQCQIVYGEELFLNQAARQQAFWV